MKNIALLTCDKMSDFVTDEDPLDQLIIENLGVHAKWISWTSETDWSQYSHAIIRTTWDYTQNKDLFLMKVKQIQAQGVQLFNSLNVVEWNSHKRYLIDLKSRGIEILKTIDLGEVSEEQTFNISRFWPQKQIMIKPFVGAASRGIEFFDNSKEGVKKIFNISKEERGKYFLQPFYKEISNGEISAVFFNKKLSHALKKTPKAGDFRSQEEYGSHIEPYSLSDKEIIFCEGLLSKIGEPLLYARIDFILLNNLPHLMELELIEPALYFRTSDKSFNNFLAALDVALRENQ